MRKSYCDKCGKEVTEETHFQIDSVEKNVKGSCSKRITFDSDTEEETITDSWVNYVDLHFCDECWGSLNIKKYVKLDNGG